MVTSPADGMAAAPIAAKVAVNAITQMLPNPRATPCACKDGGHAAYKGRGGTLLSTPREDSRLVQLEATGETVFWSH